MCYSGNNCGNVSQRSSCFSSCGCSRNDWCGSCGCVSSDCDLPYYVNPCGWYAVSLYTVVAVVATGNGNGGCGNSGCGNCGCGNSRCWCS